MSTAGDGRKEVVMPNRVDGNVQGATAAAARPEARQAPTAAERQQAEGASRPEADRVEISREGQNAQASTAPEAPAENGNTRGAALDAPGADRSPEIERREANVEQQRETASREQADTARQQPESEQPGNLVDVTA